MIERQKILVRKWTIGRQILRLETSTEAKGRNGINSDESEALR